MVVRGLRAPRVGQQHETQCMHILEQNLELGLDDLPVLQSGIAGS